MAETLDLSGLVIHVPNHGTQPAEGVAGHDDIVRALEGLGVQISTDNLYAQSPREVYPRAFRLDAMVFDATDAAPGDKTDAAAMQNVGRPVIALCKAEPEHLARAQHAIGSKPGRGDRVLAYEQPDELPDLLLGAMERILRAKYAPWTSNTHLMY